MAHLVRSVCELAREHEEPIVAPDGRVARIEEAGDAAIAQDAAAILANAVDQWQCSPRSTRHV